MARARGLDGVPQLRTERKASSVVQTMQGSGSTGQAVHVDDVAANPRNPQARAVNIADLVPSVSEVGVMVPILLTPVGEWLEAHPEDAEAVAGKSWVAQDGHRRIAAARRAGRPEVPYVVRGVDVDEAMIRLHTAKAMRLTPIEEAGQYRHLIEVRQMTQQAIAAQTGVSQSHVAKRLKLLTLPESIQAAVDYGRIEVGEALKLAALKDADLVTRAGEEVAQAIESAGNEPSPVIVDDDTELDDVDDTPEAAPAARVDLAAVVRRVTTEREVEAGQAAAKARAEELGAEYCENIYARIGDARYNNQIYSAADVRKAAAEKNLLVAATRSEPAYYLIRRTRLTPDDKQTIEARNRKAAIAARGNALRLAATAKVPTATLTEALVTMALTGLALGSQTTALAYDLARQAELAPDGLGDWTWRKTLAVVPDAQRAPNAWVIALAAFEAYTRPEHLSWGPVHRYYFELLHQLASYVPTEWEQARLDAITDEED
ncbi:MAG: ParB/RepB/Spo0J family partition protein [Propionibacteriales bacterium]|jgi:ParB family chromosome partitioning protein|nr:ParB/RepB/Spo0J family partition protein [Propionibacteriales bacterium]